MVPFQFSSLIDFKFSTAGGEAENDLLFVNQINELL